VNFLLDHDVPDDVIDSLLALGHDVHKLRDVLPASTADEEVLRMASERNSIDYL
jgi:predicted nuclease of predicted toxin-antitoxin system